jgi:hypothetical protein
MATLTPVTRVRGFGVSFLTRTSALVRIGWRVSHVHTDGLKRGHVGGGYRTTYTCYRRLPSEHGVDQVHPCHPLGSGPTVHGLGAQSALLSHSAHTGCPIGQGLETGARFPEG